MEALKLGGTLELGLDLKVHVRVVTIIGGALEDRAFNELGHYSYLFILHKELLKVIVRCSIFSLPRIIILHRVDPV